MNDSLRQTKDGGDCKVFVYIGMCYIFLNHLIKTHTSQSTDMSLDNKSLDRKSDREKIK